MIHASASERVERPVRDPRHAAAPLPGAAPPTAGAAPLVPAEGVTAGLDPATAMIQLRRLRYYRDLLVEAFESTFRPDRPAGTRRQERVALGIDHPELDAVALWSVRCGDGTVAIPFIEYILAGAYEAASAFRAADSRGRLAGCLGRLEGALRAITPPGAQAPALPRLEDVYVPEGMVARLCGPGGIFDQILDCCDTLALTMGRDTAGATS
jgi:hypothetical protein